MPVIEAAHSTFFGTLGQREKELQSTLERLVVPSQAEPKR